MTYEVADLWLTHGLPILGLSLLMVYRTRNTTRDAKAQATKIMGRRGTGGITMTPGSPAAHTHHPRRLKEPNQRA
jgi:hypothetical protein